MKTTTSRITVGIFVMLAAVGLANAQSTNWRPVTPAELDMKTPKVEPDADAEALFWETRIDDKKSDKLSYEHYVRIKLFTVRGREKYSKMDIPFTKGIKIEDIAARVTKPDGSTVELRPGDIIEREVVKSNKTRILAKSFALPSLEPGAIIEYQFKETIKNDTAEGERLSFQRDIPMQRVSYYVRPAKDMTIKYRYFNMDEAKFVPERDGFSVATVYDVPSYAEEPFMPPPDEVRRWVYLSYDVPFFGTSFNFTTFGMQMVRIFAESTKPTKEIQQKAAELVAGAANDDEKVRRIYTFCQKQIRNLTYDRNITDEQRAKIESRDATDALKRGQAPEFMVDILFASLVKAAGLEAKLVYAGNRAENFFSPEKFPSRRFVHIAGIAVKIGDKFQYFDPGVPYLPYGSVFWYEEVIRAMVIGTNGWAWSSLPLTTYDKSKAKRKGNFTLSEDGTLTGHAHVEYTGQEAITRRHDYYFDSPEKRNESFKNVIVSRFTAAEISNIAISNFDDNEKPLVYDYDIKIPNYAQLTGKRMFVQPSYFEYGIRPVFSSATRRNNIYFDYPWSEEDEVEIEFPSNFAGEGVASPPAVKDGTDLGSLEISVSVMSSKDKNTLRLYREFHFGGGDSLLFPVASYQPLKAMFDRFSKADAHTVTLKAK